MLQRATLVLEALYPALSSFFLLYQSVWMSGCLRLLRTSALTVGNWGNQLHFFFFLLFLLFSQGTELPPWYSVQSLGLRIHAADLNYFHSHLALMHVVIFFSQRSSLRKGKEWSSLCKGRLLEFQYKQVSLDLLDFKSIWTPSGA